MVSAAHDLLPDRRLQPQLRPRLASCLSLAGPGSREFLAPTTRRWGGGGIWHLPRAVPVPPDHDLAAYANKRHIFMHVKKSMSTAISGGALCCLEFSRWCAVLCTYHIVPYYSVPHRIV